MNQIFILRVFSIPQCTIGLPYFTGIQICIFVHTEQLQPSTGLIRNIDIIPSVSRRSNIQLIFGIRYFLQFSGSSFDNWGSRTIRQVHPIREIQIIFQIIHHKTGNFWINRLIHPNTPNQLMDTHCVQQGQIRITIASFMGRLHFVVRKMSL